MNAARKPAAPLPAPVAGRGATVAAGGPVAAMHQALATALSESHPLPAGPAAPGLAERVIAGSSRLAGPVILLTAAAALVRAIY